MLKLKCERCKRELVEPGGLLFTPPDLNNQCRKIHLCVECCKEIVEEIMGSRSSAPKES